MREMIRTMTRGRGYNGLRSKGGARPASAMCGSVGRRGVRDMTKAGPGLRGERDPGRVFFFFYDATIIRGCRI